VAAVPIASQTKIKKKKKKIPPRKESQYIRQKAGWAIQSILTCGRGKILPAPGIKPQSPIPNLIENCPVVLAKYMDRWT
jgi:hypothetical protein